MKYQSDLTTAEAVYRQLLKANPGAPLSTAQAQFDDLFDYLSDIIPEVSDYIATECGFSFVPYKEAKMMYFRDIARDDLYDPKHRLLWLPDELLVAASVTWDTTLLAATDYRLHPTDEYAAWGLLFNPATSLAWSSDFNAGIEISGTWGYALNGSQAYTTLDSSITVNSSATTIDVDDATIFEILSYVKCENELMQVVNKTINTDPTSDTITVLRGVNGHTAAAHTTQPLQVYNVVRGVRHVATRMAAYLYQKRLDVGGAVQIGDSAFLIDALPASVKAMMNMRKKLSFGHV